MDEATFFKHMYAPLYDIFHVLQICWSRQRQLPVRLFTADAYLLAYVRE